MHRRRWMARSTSVYVVDSCWVQREWVTVGQRVSTELNIVPCQRVIDDERAVTRTTLRSNRLEPASQCTSGLPIDWLMALATRSLSMYAVRLLSLSLLPIYSAAGLLTAYVPHRQWHRKQVIESACLQIGAICRKNCRRRLLFHFKPFVQNDKSR